MTLFQVMFLKYKQANSFIHNWTIKRFYRALPNLVSKITIPSDVDVFIRHGKVSDTHSYLKKEYIGYLKRGCTICFRAR